MYQVWLAEELLDSDNLPLRVVSQDEIQIQDIYFLNVVTAPNLSPLAKLGFFGIFLNPIVSKVSTFGLEK